MKPLILFACFAALAAAQEKQQPPPGGTPKPFTVPALQAWSLKNGAKASMVSYGRLPLVVVSASVRAGNINEGPNEVWLADLTGELMKEGAGSRTGSQIAEAAASMGGQLVVLVGPDQTRVYIEVLSEFAPQAVQLVADVLQRPTLPANEVPRLKNDMLRRLAVSRSRPQAIADELFHKALYPDHPYGRVFPTEEMLKSYSVETVQKFYKSNFGAQRTSIYVTGMFDAAAVRKAISGAFEGWEKGPEVATNIPKPAAARSFHVSDRPGAPQSTIRIGLPVPHPAAKDYLALDVMDSLLGGSFMSRITTNIREQKGYTYSPISDIATHYRDAYWAHRSDVTTASTGAAMTEIFNEIERVRKEPPSAEELNGFQQNMAGTFVLRNSSPGGILNQLNFVDLHGLGDEWLNTYVQRVMAVKPGDVQRVAETYITPNKMTTVVVGDQAKIKDQLAPFRQQPE